MIYSSLVRYMCIQTANIARFVKLNNKLIPIVDFVYKKRKITRIKVIIVGPIQHYNGSVRICRVIFTLSIIIIYGTT